MSARPRTEQEEVAAFEAMSIELGALLARHGFGRARGTAIIICTENGGVLGAGASDWATRLVDSIAHLMKLEVLCSDCGGLHQHGSKH